MTPLRILLAVRDPAFTAILRESVERAGATVLGSIDPAQQGDFLDWPGLADVVLMKAGEVVALRGQRRSILRGLHAGIRVLAVVREEDLIDIAALPQRVDGLIFVAPGRRLTRSQIELALAGYCVFPRDARRLIAADWQQIISDRLDENEQRVLRLLGVGCTNREIGAEMGCSETRAKTLVRSVLSKLRIRNRTVAAMIAASVMRLQPPQRRARGDGPDDPSAPA